MRTGAALAAFLLATASVYSTGTAQRAPRAASAFATVVRAAEALAAVDPVPADANGALRRWDRTWRRSLETIARRRSDQDISCVLRPECSRRVDCALNVVTAAYAVLSLRDGLLRDDDGPVETRIAAVAIELAARRLSSEEADRRHRESLSCEDLPDAGDMTEALGDVLEELPQDDRTAAMFDVAREGAAGLARHLTSPPEADE